MKIIYILLIIILIILYNKKDEIKINKFIKTGEVLNNNIGICSQLNNCLLSKNLTPTTKTDCLLDLINCKKSLILNKTLNANEIINIDEQNPIDKLNICSNSNLQNTNNDFTNSIKNLINCKLKNISSKIIYIKSSDSHTVFLTDAGNVYSCGYNPYGQLGLGDLINRNIPTLISNKYFTGKVIQVKCKGYFTLFLTDTGNVYSCGYNSAGQLGIGNNIIKNTPTVISNTYFSGKVINIYCGYEHSLFLTDTGNLYGCGSNIYGQLGLEANKNIPTLILQNISQVYTSSYYNIIIGNDNSTNI